MYSRLPRAEYVIAAGEYARQGEFDSTNDLRVARLPLTLSTWGAFSFGGLRGYSRALRALGRLVRKHQVTQVHCGRCLPEGVMALGLKDWYGLPYACYIHGEEINYTALSRELHWLARRVVAGLGRGQRS